MKKIHVKISTKSKKIDKKLPVPKKEIRVVNYLSKINFVHKLSSLKAYFYSPEWK